MRHDKSFLGLMLLSIATAGLLIGGMCGCDDDKITDITPPAVALAIPIWSPDGEWIAINRFGDFSLVPNGIYMIKPDGSQLHLVYEITPLTPMYDFCWSPDGQWLAYNTTASILKIKANGDSLTTLAADGIKRHCSWSHSDSLIAYERPSGDSAGIWLMKPDGTERKPFLYSGVNADFTNDDSLFYIAGSGQGQVKFAMINVSDSTERVICTVEIGNPYSLYEYPAVSPDGQTIAFCIDGEIRTMSAVDGSNVQTLTSGGGEYPDWSPDGQYIVYCEPTQEPQCGVIRIMNADGSEKRVLVDWGAVE